MNSVDTYVRRGKYSLRQLWMEPKIHATAKAMFYILSGFILSAGSLLQTALPLAMALVWACSGWSAVLAALGSVGGYYLFWNSAGYQPMVWVALSLAGGFLLGERRFCRETQMIGPAVGALIVAASGVAFQSLAGDTTSITLFLLRVVLAGTAVWVFTQAGRNPVLRWLAWSFGVLAMAQILPFPYFGLGYFAAGALSVAGPFPVAALAGLALDLAQVTPVPMTAVMVPAFLVGLLPGMPRWCRQAAPGCAYILVMSLCRLWDPVPILGLILGGVVGVFLPEPGKLTHRRGEVGVAQVRLEMAAGVMAQTQQLLLEVPEVPVDEDAVLSRAAERACGSCPYRKNCKDSKRIGQLPGQILHQPLLTAQELPIICRKSGRILAELHRAQEQLRSIRADRQRQKEYRAAVIQQYQFITEYLQDLSDGLSQRPQEGAAYYEPDVGFYGNRPEPDNGDRCMRFAGVMCKYYVLLCDGMGTGLGAVQEGRTAAGMLKKMLSAGYPAQYALRSLNSLCALRDRAGAFTVDLAELDLNSGKAVLYKWGAAPSYVVSAGGAEKIGTASPPPGISVSDGREMIERLSLRRAQTLIMASDGVGEEDALRCLMRNADLEPGKLARCLLTGEMLGGEDDATVITVRLNPRVTPT